ncbi:MAG: type II toxin-antitoxin system Phd/YefM family antitoxin [Gammaproteobacteria bacterium]|nr:type II toxin-antitoxin system Phd/YefM family antitoxin [Gammaproteobacteria bacterium]
MIQWALQDAKNRFSALVDAALSGQPQQVTRRGKPAVVVLSINEYDRLRNPALGGGASFIEHLLAIPSGADDFEFERMPLSSRASAL